MPLSKGPAAAPPPAAASTCSAPMSVYPMFVPSSIVPGKPVALSSAPPVAALLSEKSCPAALVNGSTACVVLPTGSLRVFASRTPWVVLWGVGLGALSDGGLRGLITAQGGDLARREQRGQVMGMLSISGDVGNTLGPVVAYALLPWLGLTGVYLVCAALLALGSLSAPWLRSRGSV